MPDYKDHKKWGCPKYRDWQPNQTYDVRITEENLSDRTVCLRTYAGTQQVCMFTDKVQVCQARHF